jgi:hypothetical protein
LNILQTRLMVNGHGVSFQKEKIRVKSCAAFVPRAH